MPINMESKFKRIVILRTDRIGEVLLSTVAVDAVKRQYPGSKVYFVTSSYSEPLLSDREDIEEVFLADTFTRRGWILRAIALAGALRPCRFDAAIVLNPSKMLHLACFMAGIKIRAGYSRKWGSLLNRKAADKRDQGLKHEIEYTLDLLKLIGIELEPFSPTLRASEKSCRSVEAILKDKGYRQDRPLIAVHPGSSNPAKLWPSAKFARLIRSIKKDLDCDVAVLGSGGEREVTASVIKESASEAIDLGGILDLKGLAALLSRASLYIGNDNGPMHMAAALGVPVIAVFGRNIPGVGPVRWGPWGEKHTVFHKDPGCDPCYDTKCPYNFKCLDNIGVEEVLEAAKDIMERGKK